MAYKGYTPEYERLTDALKRVVATGATEIEAKRDICAAVADRAIDVHVTIERSDLEYGDRTLSSGNVAVPRHLTPDDLDWDASRPRAQWEVGPDGKDPQQRYFSMKSTKPRTITLIELRTADVLELLCDGGKEKPDARQSAQMQSIEAAVQALWPGSLPAGMPVGKRDDLIMDWQRKNRRTVASERTLRRYFGGT